MSGENTESSERRRYSTCHGITWFRTLRRSTENPSFKISRSKLLSLPLVYATLPVFNSPINWLKTRSARGENQVSRAEGVRNITSLRGWNATKQDKRVSSTRKNGIGSDTFGVGFSFDRMISIDGRVTVMTLTLAYCYVPLPQSKCPPWRWKFELSHYMLAFI